jgi:hypothetical protein
MGIIQVSDLWEVVFGCFARYDISAKVHDWNLARDLRDRFLQRCDTRVSHMSAVRLGCVGTVARSCLIGPSAAGEPEVRIR